MKQYTSKQKEIYLNNFNNRNVAKMLEKVVDFQLIKLIDAIEVDFILGSDQGNTALEKLRSRLWVKARFIEISLEGITGFDACFVRNCLASLTKMFIGNKGLFISHVDNEDVLDNLVYGYHAKQVPLIIKSADGSGEIYSELSSGSQSILSYAYGQSQITTQKLAKHFDISTPNASAKLKKLFKAGYLLSDQQDAATGGIEFIYSPYFNCQHLSYPRTP